MVIDYTITIGNIIEIGSIVGGGILVLWTLKADVNTLKSGAESLRDDLNSMQVEIRKMGEILIAQADIRGELRVLGTRITATEGDIRELRHGEGFVRGHRTTIDGEYK